MGQLSAPTGVSSTLEGTGANQTLKVSWNYDSTNDVKGFSVTFVRKGTSDTYTPDKNKITFSSSPLSAFLSAPDPASSTPSPPTLDTLSKDYQASVVANPNNATDTASAPGLQIYWEVGWNLTLTVGTKTFTLEPAANGIYHLPVSPAAPLTINLQDIKTFANRIGYSGSIPEKWPNDQPINGELTLTKLAVDTKNKLFALDVSFGLTFTPIDGLTFDSVGISVLRTDGVTKL